MSSRSPPLGAQRFGRSQTPESPRPITIPEPSNIPVLQNQMDPVFNDTATYDIRPDSQPSAAFKNTSSESSEMHYEDLNAKSHALQQSLLNGQVESQRAQNHNALTYESRNSQSSLPQQTEQLMSSAPASHAITKQYKNQLAEPQEYVPSSEEASAQPEVFMPQTEEGQGPVANGDQTGIDYESILASINASTSDIVPIATTSAPEDANVPFGNEKPLPAAIGLPPKPPLSEIPTNFAQYNLPDSFQSSYYPNPSASTATTHEIDTSPITASPTLDGPAPLSASSQHAGAFPAQLSASPQKQNVPDYIPQPSDTERPWGPEIQHMYDKFLEDERMFVTEGVWDKFPVGSRLFVGNLPTEKVTKRDLFHIFHKYGQLAQISIKQAYGFVQFLQAADCQAALQAEQGVELRERLLHLEISKPQRNTRNANQGGNRAAPRRRSRSPDRAMSRVSNDRGSYSNRPSYSDYRDEPVRRRDDYRPIRSPSPRGYRTRDDHRGHDERYSGNVQSPQIGNHNYPVSGHPPFDDDAMLSLPRRAPRDVPDVQLLVLEDVGHQLVNFVEQGFRAKGLTAQTIWLNPRLALAVVIKRQIIEGVQAVVKLTHGAQYNPKIPLQVFDRTPGTTNVNFNEYVDLDVQIAADIVIQARQKERMAGQRPAPSPYPPQQGFQPPQPPQQFQQSPPIQHQYGQQLPVHQYQPPRPQSQQYQPPQMAQYGTPQQSPQTPNGAANLQELLANLNRQPPGNPNPPQPQQQATPTQQAVPDLAGLLQNVAARQQNHSIGGYGQGQGQGYVPPQQQHPQYGRFQIPTPNQQYGALQQPQQSVQNVMDQLARYRP